MSYRKKPKPGNVPNLCRVCFKQMKDFEYFNNSDICYRCSREIRRSTMSHVKAVRCNYCGNIRPLDEIVGIIATEDMFNKLKSFPTVFTETLIQRTNVHYCTTCYYNHVTKVITIDKGRDPEGYENEAMERAYMLRRKCVLHPAHKPIDIS